MTELIERLEEICKTIGTRIESQGISIFDEELFNEMRDVIEELKELDK